MITQLIMILTGLESALKVNTATVGDTEPTGTVSKLKGFRF